MTSCRVLWREGKGPINAGTIELGPAGLVLEGSCHGRNRSLRTIGYEDIAGMRLTVAPEEAIYRKLTLVLGLRGRGAVELASVDGNGSMPDLEARIATLCRGFLSTSKVSRPDHPDHGLARR
jgi:hypothetical protein